jgi:hypothetical protein
MIINLLMKKNTISLFIVFALTALFTSCSYNPSTPGTVTTMHFAKDFTAYYDISNVDTSGSGHNGDSILVTGRISVTDVVIDTNVTWAGKSHAVLIKTYQGSQVVDSQYYYQDPNGDLYRYNFAFSILNEFPYLKAGAGGSIDVGWVLAAKINSGSGTTWIPRSPDTLVIQSGLNIPVVLASTGQMMTDTTITVNAVSVKVRHSHVVVSATAVGVTENGTAVIDSYYSTDINATVEDFYRHVTLTGFFNQQEQGKFKIMTSH